jgi:heavy metal sensor kinase
MIRSIRGRLQAWYALVLLAVVASFAGLLYYRVRETRFREIDVKLESAGQYLDAALRSAPPGELDGPRPERPPRPGGERGPEGRDRPPPPGPGGPGGPRGSREHFLASLVPPGFEPVEGGPGWYSGVWRADGTVLKTSALPTGTQPPVPVQPDTRRPVFSLYQRGEFREGTLLGPHGSRILVGKPIGQELAELTAFAWQLAGLGLLVLGVGLAGGWLLSARLLRPIAHISATASAISADNLSERIDTSHVDSELTELAGVLNAMFGRLEAAFERQMQFTADASHELRTPLTILRTHAELALARPRSPQEYRETLETCLRAASRMTALVEGLLTLARADAGTLELRHEPVDLTRVVGDTVDLFAPLALRKEVKLSSDLDAVTVTGDAGRLAQVVTNLVGNAIQYNQPGGTVHVHLTTREGQALLSVQDTGCGIPQEDRPHLFERFYRVDKARSRESGGNGLGLAICKSIVEGHGGTIGFDSTAGRGSTFWVRLPATGPALLDSDPTTALRPTRPTTRRASSSGS